MKKLLLAFLAIASFVFASDNAYKSKIEKLVSEKTQREISVKEVLDLDGSKDVKVVILLDKKDKAEIAVLATKDGNVILGLSNVFISTSQKDLMILAEAYQATQPKPEPPKPEVLNKFFPSLASNRLISFESKAKNPKKTYYLVSDPRCPGCRKELGEIEEKLKDGNVKILLVAFLGDESAYKAKLIYNKLAKVKDNATKLKVMQEIYNPSYKLTPKDKKQDIKMIEENNKDVEKAGIQAIPFEHIIKK